MELPAECYVNPSGEQQIAEESNEYWALDRLDWTNKIEMWLMGAMFPLKGFVNPPTLWAMNMLKSSFIEALKVFAMPRFIPGLIVTMLSVKKLEIILVAFNRLGFRIVSPYLLKDKHLSDLSVQLQFLIFTYLVELGIKEPVADRFSNIFVHMIEYDNAYRLRLEDIFSETSVEKLQKPRKELKRLAKIAKDRDAETTGKKIWQTFFLIRLSLLIPRFKKAFKKVVSVMDITKLQLDDADAYWTCLRTDYKFMGMTLEERMTYATSRGWTYPKSTIQK